MKTIANGTTLKEVFDKVYVSQVIPYRIAVTSKRGLLALSKRKGSLDGIPDDLLGKKVWLTFVSEGKYVDPYYDPLRDSNELFWEICVKEEGEQNVQGAKKNSQAFADSI